MKKYLPLLLVFGLMGCTPSEVNSDEMMQTYNYRPLTMYEIKDNKLYISGNVSRTYYTADIEAEELTPFDHDILHSFQDSEIRCVVPLENSLYYLRVKDVHNFYIVKRELETNHETIIYSDTNFKLNEDNIVPFFSETYNITDHTDFPQSFVIKGENLFVIYDRSVDFINLSTHKKKRIIDDFGSISTQDHYLYYLDVSSNMMQYDIDTGISEVLFHDLVDKFEVSSEGLYFTNLNDYNNLYFYSFEKATQKKIIDKKISAFSVYDQSIAYYDDEKISIYDLATDKKTQVEGSIGSGFKFKILNQQYLIYQKNNNDLILFDYIENIEYTKELPKDF